MKIWYSSGFSECNCKVGIGVWGNNFTPFFTNGPLMSYMYPVLTIAEVICPKNLTHNASRISDQSFAKYWDSNSGQKIRWRPNLRSEKVNKNYNKTILSRILLKFFPRIIHAYEQNSARNLNCKISWPQLINWWSLIGELRVQKWYKTNTLWQQFWDLWYWRSFCWASY